jgi:LysM repeat protein
MHRSALGKHGWSVCAGLLLFLAAPIAAQANPGSPVVEVAIGSPLPNSVVAGTITLSVAYDGIDRPISAFTVSIDGEIHYSRGLSNRTVRGIQYLELDTRTIPDGVHTVRVSAMGSRGVLNADEVRITVRNGLGGQDIVPPLVQFRGLRDGDTVAGRIVLDVLAEDNTTQNLLVTIFANREPLLIQSFPPYTLDLNTARYLDPATGTGTIHLEAWAYDKAMNLGKARPITINVIRPGASPNQTPRQNDPTNPLAGGPKGAAVRAESPAWPLADRPVTRMAMRQPEVIDPELAEAGLPDSGTAGEGQRGQAPMRRPVTARVDDRPGDLSAPETIRADMGQPTLGGVRIAQPVAVRPGTSPSLPAGAPTQEGLLIIPVPGVAASAVRESLPNSMPAPEAIEGEEMVTQMGGVRAAPPGGERMASAKVPSAPVEGIPVVAPPAQPLTAGPKPGTRMAKADPQGQGPLVVVVDPSAKASGSGRVPVEIYRAKSGGPEDVHYRMKQGDTLHSVARQFNVTPKALQVANGITNGNRVRAGSTIRVPGTFDVVLNDRQVSFDVSPRFDGGVPLAPFRQILEHAGGMVVWYPESREVRAATEETDVKLQIGSREAIVNQTVVVMDREAFIDRGRTMVPLSFMEKALDLKAEYDPRTRSVILSRK